MKIVGAIECSGKNKKTGLPWAGVKLYYTEPLNRGGVGFYAGEAFFNGDAGAMVRGIGGENFGSLIGADVQITYDRFGHPAGVSFL